MGEMFAPTCRGMRWWLAIGAAALAGLPWAAASAPADARAAVSAAIEARTSEAADALLLSAAAAYFGLSRDAIVKYRADAGEYGYFSLLFAAGQRRLSPDTLIVERRRGRSWAEIYRVYRLEPPGKWIS
ncbi:MAG TPA: hypothetical protein VF234_08420, partial [Limnochordia bacterium]